MYLDNLALNANSWALFQAFQSKPLANEIQDSAFSTNSPNALLLTFMFPDNFSTQFKA